MYTYIVCAVSHARTLVYVLCACVRARMMIKRNVPIVIEARVQVNCYCSFAHTYYIYTCITLCIIGKVITAESPTQTCHNDVL